MLLNPQCIVKTAIKGGGSLAGRCGELSNGRKVYPLVMGHGLATRKNGILGGSIVMEPRKIDGLQNGKSHSNE